MKTPYIIDMLYLRLDTCNSNSPEDVVKTDLFETNDPSIKISVYRTGRAEENVTLSSNCRNLI